MGEMVSITSRGTWMARTPWGSSGSASPSVTTTVVRGAFQRSASSSSLTPSPRYSPASRRALALPEDSFLIFIKSGFFLLVIRSIITLQSHLSRGSPTSVPARSVRPASTPAQKSIPMGTISIGIPFRIRQFKGLMLEISRFVAFKSTPPPDPSRLSTAWRRRGSGHPPSADSGPHGHPPHAQRRSAFPQRRYPSSCGAAG